MGNAHAFRVETRGLQPTALSGARLVICRDIP